MDVCVCNRARVCVCVCVCVYVCLLCVQALVGVDDSLTSRALRMLDSLEADVPSVVPAPPVSTPGATVPIRIPPHVTGDEFQQKLIEAGESVGGECVPVCEEVWVWVCACVRACFSVCL